MSRQNKDAYKNQFGHVLVLAGSARMLGAAVLTSLAAMRAGAGLVSCGVPRSLNAALHKRLSPVVMTLPLAETPQQSFSRAAFSQLRGHWPDYQAVAIGPGLSRHRDTQAFVRRVITAAGLPMVIDADALNALSGALELLASSTIPKVLTPHPGEMARLCGRSTAEVEARRVVVARDFAREHQCVLVLKGHHTVIADPGGRVTVNQTGNAGMATAGSGDVLTGIVSALLAQGLPADEAARWGVALHGAAGDAAARQQTRMAMIATDIIEALPAAVTALNTRRTRPWAAA